MPVTSNDYKCLKCKRAGQPSIWCAIVCDSCLGLQAFWIGSDLGVERRDLGLEGFVLGAFALQEARGKVFEDAVVEVVGHSSVSRKDARRGARPCRTKVRPTPLWVGL